MYFPTALTGETPFLYIPVTAGTAVSVGTGPSGTAWQLKGATASAGSTVQTGAWQCVELDINLAGASMSLYVTDAASPDARAPAIATTAFAGTFTDFYLGIYAAPSAGNADVWFDDVVVAATNHIGCE
jgi:hypothetical protein